MCGQKVVGRMTETTQKGDKGYNTGYLYQHQRSHLQLIKAHTYMVKVASLISLSVTKIHYQFVRSSFLNRLQGCPSQCSTGQYV